MAPRERCIVAYPEGVDPWVAEFRRAHHPRGASEPPHVTFVFPFTSSLSATILHHHAVGAAVSCEAFDMSFGPAEVGDDGVTVWLPVDEGASSCRRLYDALYGGPLNAFRGGRPYRPHLTLAEVASGEADAVAEEARAHPTSTVRVSTLVIESIGRDGNVEDEARIDLAG